MTNKNKNQIIHFCLDPDFYPDEGASYKYLSFHVCALDYFCKMFAIIKLNNKVKSSFLNWLLVSSSVRTFYKIIHASRLPKISLYAFPLIRVSSYL